jgi:hypothetical protein
VLYARCTSLRESGSPYTVALHRGNAFVIFHQHPIEVLRSTLGPPGRTFRYQGSGIPNCEDHVWRCGCAAREKSGMCELTPCGRHADLNRDAFLKAAWAVRR